MAVAMHKGFPMHGRKLKRLGLFLDEFAEQKYLLRQFGYALILRKEIQQFVSKHRSAAGFENHDRSSLLNFGAENVESSYQ